jgi:hypothetical protein
MPVRRQPHPGDRVTVAFLGASVQGVVSDIDLARRRLQVLTEEGEQIPFKLSRATGQFVAENSSKARLIFEN